MINLLRSKETSIFKKGDGVAAQLRITNRGISTKVEQDGVVSAINQSPESITIDAAKVNIEGAALFTSGRLSESSLNSAYDASGTASSALASAKSYADTKVGAAEYRTQRIYYRATSATSLTGPTTWLSTSGTGYGNWSTKVPPLTNNDTKYPFLYTCVQSQTVAQSTGTTCTCTPVLLDDTATVIDGGSIITGSVAANAISATSGTFDTANIPNLSAAKITSGDIAADRIKANVISAINSLTAGTIDAARINASALTIGYSQISDTPTIPSSVSDLNDGSNYSTTTQMNTAISTAVDSIDVGGRNLLRHTGSLTTDDLFLARATINSDNSIRIASTTYAAYAKFKVDYLTYGEYKNDTYTVSCEARVAPVTTSYTNVQLRIVPFVNVTSRLNNVASENDRYALKEFTDLTSSWKKYTFTFDLPDDLTDGDEGALVDANYFTVQFMTAKNHVPIDIRSIKLERGNKPTDWTAAPEDTVNYLTTVNNTGIMVHPSNDSTSGVKVTDVVDIMRSGTSVAEYGDTARIGPSGSSHVNVGSNTIDFYGASGSDKLLSLSVLQQSYGAHGYSPTGNYGIIDFPLTGGGVVETKNGESASSLYLNATGETQPILTATLGCYDDSNNKHTGVSIDGITRDIDLTGNVTIYGNLCFSPATSIFGSNIIGIYAGSTAATLSNGNWASLASKSTLESKLGSGVTNQNTIIIAQNGDCDAVGNYAFSGAITSDGAARGYVYPAVSGSVRWNWIAIRFSN